MSAFDHADAALTAGAPFLLPRMNWKMLVRLTVFVALVAMIAIAALLRNQINSAALETWVKGAGPAGP